ncbi:hypothetical protein BH11CYA1_BH11CYA1_35900 [soil metagenome]
MSAEGLVNSWGSVPFGTSRLQVRHIVLWLGIALWLLPTLVVTGIQGIAWFAFNLAFVLILTIVATPFRSITIHKIGTCFFAGGLTMGITVLVLTPIMKMLGPSPLRPFITVPFEEIFKLLPLAILLWRGRKFSSFTLGATDLLLMGAITGAGFAFVEDAYAHAANQSTLNNLSVWLPSSELINGRIVSGHAVWTGLAAATIGLAWLFRHLGKVFLVVSCSLGLLISTTDHLALNYNQTQGASGWGISFFNLVSASGWLPMVFFVLCLAAALGADFFVQLRSLPAAKEFKLPARKGRKDSLESLWDSVLDLRRLAYAHFRFKNFEDESCPPALALTVALLAKRLINRAVAALDEREKVEAKLNINLELESDNSAISSQKKNPAPFTIRGPGEAPSMPRAAGQAAPPNFGKLNPANGAGSAAGNSPDSAGDWSAATQVTGMGPAAGSKPTADLPFIMPYDQRPLLDIIDLPEQYEIFEQVSEGGMGVIFRGRHKRTGARLAIKVLHPHLSTNQLHLRRFEQEARTASTLDHPNIVVVHDFGVTPKSIAYLVMEWLDGSNLDPVIRIGGTISLARFLHIFIQATNALAHAHRKGVIHRDIKPSNLILATTPERPDFVKVVDFGIAKVLTEESDEGMNLTRTGDILGSPLYMSPEQCMGNKMDARSDIYSLGCVMYQALVGVTPLKGENAVQLIFRHVHDMPAQPRTIKADIELPEIMEPLLFKCLQKDPDNRFRTMDELEGELKRVQAILSSMT